MDALIERYVRNSGLLIHIAVGCEVIEVANLRINALGAMLNGCTCHLASPRTTSNLLPSLPPSQLPNRTILL